MDVIDKLTKILEYEQKSLMDFDEKVESLYSTHVEKLENGHYKYGFGMGKCDILRLIDDVSSMTPNVDGCNILYDKPLNKLKIYNSGQWHYYLFDEGIKTILQTIKNNYLDAYELFILQKYHYTKSVFDKQKMREYLMEYYKVLECFDLQPSIKELCDGDILNTSQESYDIYNDVSPILQIVQDKLTKSVINKFRKDIYDIVKRNAYYTMTELNKLLLSMFKVDEEFAKKTLMPVIIPSRRRDTPS